MRAVLVTHDKYGCAIYFSPVFFVCFFSSLFISIGVSVSKSVVLVVRSNSPS